MSIRYLAMVATGLFIAGNAFAGDGEALAKSNNCTSCHSVDKKKVGPSFKDIAAKYEGNADAQAMLEKKVRNGGKGAWGSMPMPATSQKASDADIKDIVQWILSLK